MTDPQGEITASAQRSGAPFIEALAADGLRLLLFGGKGGVGKTTCAAAAGVSLALRHPQARFLLVSVDPAHSLRDCLAGEAPPANLEVLELDAPAVLEEFLGRHGATLKEIARRGTFLEEADIERFVSLSLPGLDELIAFLRIADWLAQPTYRTVIIDTAPSGHTVRLLAMPALLRDWLDALDALLAKERYMRRLFRGAYQPDAPDLLLLALSDAVSRTRALLCSPQACFVPVLLAEPLSLDITERLLEQLRDLGARIGPLVWNRRVPPSDCPACQRVHAGQRQALLARPALLAGRSAWALPLLPVEVRGVASLATFFFAAVPLAEALAPAPDEESADEADSLPLVVAPAPVPEDSLAVLLFAGKGGVGKTTLACAAALRLSSPPRPRPVLLVSTDPAHSIGGCLGVTVDAEPRELRPGLWALAIDATAEWRGWQGRYADELELLLTESLPQLDLTFDREVMERLLALSPPGVDEIMALTRVMDLLAERPGALLVLDTAPTGHLLRLLEMPELLDGWLKAIFGVLLRYRTVLRLPRLSDQLIALSRRLKVLRALLRDPRRARLYPVAIPTWLSEAETRDLLAACARQQVAVGRLFINQRTQTAACGLCAALAAREAPVAQALLAAAPAGATQVYRGRAPLGMKALATLGARLFAEPGREARSAAVVEATDHGAGGGGGDGPAS